jgi:hypothetical protein
MELSVDKESTQVCLDISPLLLHTVPQLVQVPVIIHDETLQALAVEGDVLIPKPFLDLGFDGAIRWKSPSSETFSQLAKHISQAGNFHMMAPS